MSALQLLLLEPNLLDVQKVQATLSSGGIDYQLLRVDTRADFVEALETNSFDLILSDYSLPGFDGRTALEIARQQRPETPFIFVSASVGEELAIDALAAGAAGFVLKHRLERLVPCMERVLRENSRYTSTEVALREEIDEPDWAAVAQSRAGATLRDEALDPALEALRASESKYRSLFTLIDEGFCLLEVLFDSDETAYDYRFLEVNEAFEAQSGLADAVGKTILELVPNLEPQWIERYGQVAKSGNAIRFEADVSSMTRFFDIYAYPSSASGENAIAVLFTDISDRKRHELNTALLDEISKDLARLSMPDEIMQTIGRRVGEFLQVSGCWFADVDEERGEVVVHYGWTTETAPILKQTFRMEDFITPEVIHACRAGEMLVVRDTTLDERTNAENYDLRTYALTGKQNCGELRLTPSTVSGCERTVKALNGSV